MKRRILPAFQLGLIVLGCFLFIFSASDRLVGGKTFAEGPGDFKTLDDQLLEVDTLVPGFGGLYLDESEAILYVYVVGQVDPAVMERAIAQVFGPERIPQKGIKVLSGKYTIRQLMQWYILINRDILGMEGVAATDLDEARNRLWIGIKDESARSQVEVKLGQLNIPREAVAVEVWGPVSPLKEPAPRSQELPSSQNENNRSANCAARENPALSLSKSVAKAGENLTFIICFSAYEIKRISVSYLERWNGKKWVTLYLLKPGQLRYRPPAYEPYTTGRSGI